MKLELAVLPLEVWADVFESPCISRQWLAHLADNIRNRKFAEKLQKLLHECGKHSLRLLSISSKQLCKYQLGKRKISERRTNLSVAHGYRYRGYARFGPTLDYKDCEFPECEMPENIKTFKQLKISHLDDQVLDFLDKIRPLFTNVFLKIGYMGSAENMRIVLAHLLPLLGGIRKIGCHHDDMEFLERNFPGTLALAKELKLGGDAEPANIPSYLEWLNAPQDFTVHGPRFLVIQDEWEIIFAIVDAVCKQFLAASTPATFVIFLEFYWSDRKRTKACRLENAATNELLTIRDVIIKGPHPHYYGGFVHYAEILRHPVGEEAKMREWVEERAYFEKEYMKNEVTDEDANKMILITQPTIGHITKNSIAVKCGKSELTNGRDEDGTGPSTSAWKVEEDAPKKVEALNEDDWDDEEDEAGPSTSTKK